SRGAKRAGAKNNLTDEQNALLEQVWPNFQLSLEQNNVQNLESGKHLPKECSKFVMARITELLNNAKFPQPGEDGREIALKTLQIAFRNYRSQKFLNIYNKNHPCQTETSPATTVVEATTSTSAATLPVLDKLCSGVTERELFLEDFQESINERKNSIRSELSMNGGTFNAGAVFQKAQKEVWDSLPAEQKIQLKEKAQVLNSDTAKNRNNFLKFTRASHQLMAESGRLGRNTVMVTVLVCENEDEAQVKAYSVKSGVDKDVVIPGHQRFMDDLCNFVKEMVVTAFDPTNMSQEELQNIMKTYFGEVWGEYIFRKRTIQGLNPSMTEDSFGPPTVDQPGPPWLAIEKNPDDFYIAETLCITLRTPDDMTREELVKDVINRKMKEREFKEEQEGKA
ncbi:hypothetical protein BT96DRAFT_952059, partial [Gymnopus androsaceus JB14]